MEISVYIHTLSFLFSCQGAGGDLPGIQAQLELKPAFWTFTGSCLILQLQRCFLRLELWFILSALGSSVCFSAGVSHLLPAGSCCVRNSHLLSLLLDCTYFQQPSSRPAFSGPAGLYCHCNYLSCPLGSSPLPQELLLRDAPQGPGQRLLPNLEVFLSCAFGPVSEHSKQVFWWSDACTQFLPFTPPPFIFQKQHKSEFQDETGKP